MSSYFLFHIFGLLLYFCLLFLYVPPIDVIFDYARELKVKEGEGRRERDETVLFFVFGIKVLEVKYENLDMSGKIYRVRENIVCAFFGVFGCTSTFVFNVCFGRGKQESQEGGGKTK